MTPIFDRLARERGLVYVPRQIGSLTPARLLSLPPLVTTEVQR